MATFKQHVSSVAITHGIVFILTFANSILNARLLGPEGVGVITLLLLLQSLGMKITDFGFNRAFRYYSANGEIEYNSLKKIIFSLGVLVGLLVLLLSYALKISPLNIWDRINMMVYLCFLPSLFFYVLITYLRNLLSGQLLIKAVNISTITERLLYIILFIYFVWYLKLGLLGFSLSISISTLFLFLQLFIVARNHSSTFNNAETQNDTVKFYKMLWSYGKWSYYSSFLEYVFLNFPVLLLKSTVSSFSVIGYFNKAKGLSELPNQLGVPLSGLLFSYNAGSTAALAARRTEMLCRYSFWGITVVYITLGIFIEPLIIGLYGESFLPAAKVYYFLYPSAIFFVQSIYLSSALAAQGYNKETFTIRLKSIPFLVILVYLFIEYFGINGAAIAIGITFFVLWLQYAFKYKAIFNSRIASMILLQKGDLKRIKIFLFRHVADK